MIRNYIITAWRNLKRNKVFSIINILGLSIGIAIAMLIAVWIGSEVTYNKSIAYHSSIAMVMQNKTNSGIVQTGAQTPYPLGEALRNEYGNQFKQVVVATGTRDHAVRIGEKKIFLSGAFFEEGIGAMLNLKMIEGRQNGLQEPNAIMISRYAAHAAFGNDDAVGKMLTLDNHLEVKVTGVYEDLPQNSDFGTIQFMAPWKLFFNNNDWIRTADDPWRPNAFTTYVQLKDPSNIAQVSQLIKDVRLKHVNERLALQKPELFLHPMDKWYLYESFTDGINSGGRIQYVWLFGIVGIIVLLLACINFMNLSTARSIKRAREVGVRKAIGSVRKQLITQFFCESLLYAVIAYLAALGLIALAIPAFDSIAGKQLPFIWNQPAFWMFGILLCVFTGMLAGVYPALYLSSFNPAKVLKGAFSAGKNIGIQRKILLITQFIISTVLVIETIVVFRQIQFTKDRPIGYNRNGLVQIDVPNANIHNHFDAIKNILINSGTVLSVAESEATPTDINNTTTGIDWPGKDPNAGSEFPITGVSLDFGKTVGWHFLDGRDFSRDFKSDSSAVIINKSAARYMGLKNPVGTVISNDKTPFKIIGVIEDVVMESPYSPVRPSIYYLNNADNSYLIARINPESSSGAALKELEKIYKTYIAGEPFHYHFTDEAYNRKFDNEIRVANLGGCFSLLAIFISCLGLFGIAAFIAEQRTKEVGIRKVLGASVFSLWKLLSKDFIQLVLLSVFIATPLGWLCANAWLKNYIYRAPLSWWIFVSAGLLALLISLITVSTQAVKAARANPVKSLKTD